MLESVACPVVQRFAGAAVFAIGMPSADPATTALADALQIKNYPAISVLAPNNRMIEEVARIVGFVPGERLSGHLEKMLRPWSDGVPSAGMTIALRSQESGPRHCGMM